MNVVNIFWAIGAFVLSGLFCYFLWAFIAPAVVLFVATGTLMYYMTYIGLFAFTIFWLFVVPILTLMDEEDGGLFKRIVTGEIGKKD